MSKRALVCAPLMPEYDRERGSQRVFELIEFLRDAGWAVSFVAQNATGGQRYARLLQQRGVATYAGFNSRSDQLVASGHFDIAILVFWHLAESYMPTIRALSPTTRIIIDTIDLHFLRNARHILHKPIGNDSPGRLDLAYASDMIRELNTYCAADSVLAVSQKEATMVNDLVGDNSLAAAMPLSEDLRLSRVPYAKRKGILFVGNFRHPPNIEAVEFFYKQILPRLDASLTVEHPVYIVGNALEKLRGYDSHSANVRLVGWAPSVAPYLRSSRITIVPLLHGAGTKGKLIQALMVGTPTVSTSIGIEGLNLQDGEHVLVADDPVSFANSIARLLRDQQLWHRLARQGHSHVTQTHGCEAVRARLMQVISSVLSKPAKSAELCQVPPSDPLNGQYQQLKERIREVVRTTLPPSANVIVVSKGDDDLLRLDCQSAWHFPRTDAGLYAGHYPADSAEAIGHLEALRSKGGEFLLLPSTAFWWLEHYDDFKQHLERRYRLIVRHDDTCLIFGLSGATHGRKSSDSGKSIPLGPRPGRRRLSSRSAEQITKQRQPAESSALDANCPLDTVDE